MTTLMQASRQWMSRPEEERFTSLPEMLSSLRALRAITKVGNVDTGSIEAMPDPADDVKGLLLQGHNGKPATVTNWAFGQICGLAGAPAGYLRSLPSPMAADLINFGLQVAREEEQIKVMVSRDPSAGIGELRAATGTGYGRIWNCDIVENLISRFGDGRTGDFRVPGEFGQQVEITKANTTLFASDRDMFVFLADEENRIEIADRRDGKGGSLARGFFVQNSEVGSAALSVTMFLFDYVCMNRIVWGVKDLREVKIRHTSRAPERWIEEATPQLLAYAHSSAKPLEEALAAAQQKKIDDVDAFLARRLTSKALIQRVKAAHMEEEGRPIETVWDAVTGVTAHAKSLPFQDERVSLERAGGSLLDYAL